MNFNIANKLNRIIKEASHLTSPNALWGPFLLVLFWSFNTLKAQSIDSSLNLVLNPSLEHFYNCEYNYRTSKFLCVGWDNPVFLRVGGSIVDHSYNVYSYYNFNDYCNWKNHTYFRRNGGVEVFTRSGDAAFISRTTGNPTNNSSTKTIASENKHFLSGSLKDSLKKGKYYYASFYVRCNVDKASVYHKETLHKSVLLTRNISLLACHDSVFFSSSPSIFPSDKKKYKYFEYTPQIKNSIARSLLDTNQWIEISGYFKASGNESKIIIGDFTLSTYGTYDYLRNGDDTNPISLSLIYDDFTLARHPYLGPDTCIQQGETLLLDFDLINLPAERFRWSNGKTGYSITVKKPGIYWVEYDVGYTTIRDSIIIHSTNKPLKNEFLKSNISECEHDTFSLKLPNTQGSIVWSTGDSTKSILITQPGTYSVKHVGNNGCSYEDVVDVKFPRPFINFENVNTCPRLDLGSIPTLKATGGDYEYLEWFTADRFNEYINSVSDSFERFWYGYDTIYLRAIKEGCEFVDTVKVNYDDRGLAFLPFKQSTICKSSIEQKLSATKGIAKGSEILWNTGSTDSVIYATKNGWYKVEIINPTGCYSRDSAYVEIYDNKPIGDTAICYDQVLSVDLTHLPFTYNGNETSQNLEWYKDGRELTDLKRVPRALLSESGQYILNYTLADMSFDPNLWCNVSDTFNLLIDSIAQAFAISDTTLCNISEYELRLESGFDSIAWSNGGNSQSKIIYKPFGMYSAKVHRNGCVLDDTITIEADDIAYTFNGDSLICDGKEAKILVNGGFENAVWSDSIESNEIIVRKQGVYTVLLSNDLCAVRDSFVLNFYEDDVLNLSAYDTTLCKGDSLEFVRNSGVSWELDESPTPDIFYLNKDGNYLLVLYGNCDVKSANFKIEIEENCDQLFIPNAFTPNNQGVDENESFRVYGKKPVDFALYIFNRNGQRVFQTVNFNESWDGTINGEAAPMQPYYCVIEYTNSKGETKVLSAIVNLIW
ncbi:MAG: gliding motility-associated C-terminal domain-containing protein [Bacteroidia bacterium]